MDDVKKFEEAKREVMKLINHKIEELAKLKGKNLDKISAEERLSLMSESIVELEKEGILKAGNLNLPSDKE